MIKCNDCECVECADRPIFVCVEPVTRADDEPIKKVLLCPGCIAVREQSRLIAYAEKHVGSEWARLLSCFPITSLIFVHQHGAPSPMHVTPLRA